MDNANQTSDSSMSEDTTFPTCAMFDCPGRRSPGHDCARFQKDTLQSRQLKANLSKESWPCPIFYSSASDWCFVMNHIRVIPE